MRRRLERIQATCRRPGSPVLRSDLPIGSFLRLPVRIIRSWRLRIPVVVRARVRSIHARQRYMADLEAGRSPSIANLFQSPGGTPRGSMMSEAPMPRGLATRPAPADERLGACARRATIHLRPSQGREEANCVTDPPRYSVRGP